MTPQGWFQKDKPGTKRTRASVPPALPRQPESSRLAAKLRPHELIAMLTHHYTRARSRSLPKVRITLAVSMPSGKQAVVIACG